MIRLKRLKCGENGASQDSQLSGNCVSCLHACSANSLVGPSKDVVSVKISTNAIDRAPYIMWLSLNFTLTMSIITIHISLSGVSLVLLLFLSVLQLLKPNNEPADAT